MRQKRKSFTIKKVSKNDHFHLLKSRGKVLRFSLCSKIDKIYIAFPDFVDKMVKNL